MAAALGKKGVDVLCTREPGGSPEAEAIRDELVSADPGKWSPLAEALLMNAARDSHLRKTIRPALASGRTVLCDRFMDSTRAYQGVAGGVDMNLIAALERIRSSVKPCPISLWSSTSILRSGWRGPSHRKTGSRERAPIPFEAKRCLSRNCPGRTAAVPPHRRLGPARGRFRGDHENRPAADRAGT